MNHAVITKAFHSRGTFVVSVIIGAIATVIAYIMTAGPSVIPSVGFVSGWGEFLQPDRVVSLGVAVGLNVAIVALMLYINKTYNLLRAMTHLHGALFIIMMVAVPPVLYSIYPGALLCLGVLWCIALMYMVYASGHGDTRKVFLVFFILSGCSSFNYAFSAYIPIFILACFQLRFFTLRCASATVAGLITPWILFFGFGLVDVSQLQFPVDYIFTSPAEDTSSAMLHGTVFLTAIIALGALVQNAIKIITYNAQSRAMLSVITTVTILTIILSVIDINNMYSYITLLNLCAAFQLAHLFLAILNFAKSYFVILSIMLIYILDFAWNLIILNS